MSHDNREHGMSTTIAKPRKQASALALPRCLFNRHTPDRHQAKWDGYNFVSTCKNCGAKIRRVSHNNWKRDWFEKE